MTSKSGRSCLSSPVFGRIFILKLKHVKKFTNKP